MKLPGALLNEELSKVYQTVYFKGPRQGEGVGRPRFYMDNETDFLSDNLYVATADHLPQRPRIQQNAVLVCIGDSINLHYYKDRLDLIQIRNRADFFKVYTALQDICDKYDEWERKLGQDVLEDADMDRLIADSEAIFRRPMYVLDRSFQFIASSGEDSSTWMQEGSRSLNPESIEKFLSVSELLTEKRNAMVLNIYDIETLCVNLFQKNGQYAGCLCLDLQKEPMRKGEDKLAECLASYLQLLLDRNPKLISGSQDSLKRVMQTLIEEQPLSRAQRVLLRSANHTVPYVCLYLRSMEKNQKLPLSYLCDIFEESFQDSHAFIHEEAIVALVNDSLYPKEKDRMEFTKALRRFCGQMRLGAGVSNVFQDYLSIRMYYTQAKSALEDGRLLNREDTVFYFSSYALTEMIINSLGGLPAEGYYPEGLKAILEHDAKSPVSYMETVRIFLEENLNYTSTAQRLYIHRSTLIDRIDRIEKEMNIDLKNPDQRLQLEILLKAMDLEEVMRKH